MYSASSLFAIIIFLYLWLCVIFDNCWVVWFKFWKFIISAQNNIVIIFFPNWLDKLIKIIMKFIWKIN